ncbi:MAG TPA: hypothetical protein VEX11_10880 [Acetobacteraceae bacterium]|nr:hypothetical protein [Acetobacteraceae bacterium]
MAGLTHAGQTFVLSAVQTQYPYLALTTTAPTDATAGSETTYTGYLRKQMIGGDWTAGTAAAPSVSTNANTVNFAQCTGGSSTVTHFELWSAVSGGTRGMWGALAAPLAISNGITPSWAPSQITMTAD